MARITAHTHTIHRQKIDRKKKDLERINNENLSSCFFFSLDLTVYSCQEINVLLDLLYKYQFSRYLLKKPNEIIENDLEIQLFLSNGRT